MTESFEQPSAELKKPDVASLVEKLRQAANSYRESYSDYENGIAEGFERAAYRIEKHFGMPSGIAGEPVTAKRDASDSASLKVPDCNSPASSNTGDRIAAPTPHKGADALARAEQERAQRKGE